MRVSRETKGRAGKGVTVIRGLALEPAALADLGKRLKAACGTGGTVKDGTIELQGDHRDAALGLIDVAVAHNGSFRELRVVRVDRSVRRVG